MSEPILPRSQLDIRFFRLLEAKGASFEHATIYRANVAAAPLAAWVKANLAVSKVLHDLAPLEAANRELEDALGASRARVEECAADAASLDASVTELRAAFATRTAEAETLKASVAAAEATLASAQRLLRKLGGERERWEETRGGLNEELGRLGGDSLLAAAAVVFLAGETDEGKRRRRMVEWEGVVRAGGGAEGGGGGVGGGGGGGGGCGGNHGNMPPLRTNPKRLPPFSLLRFLSSEDELLRWRSLGLPNDERAAEAALALTRTPRTPFIIDGAGQATPLLSPPLPTPYPPPTHPIPTP